MKNIFVLMLCFLGLGFAHDNQANDASESWLSNDLAPFEVQIKARQNHYQVGEAMQFEVRGNRPFFLYLFSLHPGGQQASMILPNTHARGNHYPANYTFLVPNASVAFRAEQPGTLKIVMVASRHSLEFDAQDAPSPSPFHVTQTKSIDGVIKGISLRPTGQAGQKNIIIKELDIHISAATPDNAINQTIPANVPPISFVVTDKRHYQPGEHVHILYGANQAGWLQLYLARTGGKRQLLKEHDVTGQNFHTLKALAQKTKGGHQLIVRFHPTHKPAGIFQLAAQQDKSPQESDTSVNVNEFIYQLWID